MCSPSPRRPLDAIAVKVGDLLNNSRHRHKRHRMKRSLFYYTKSEPSEVFLQKIKWTHENHSWGLVGLRIFRVPPGPSRPPKWIYPPSGTGLSIFYTFANPVRALTVLIVLGPFNRFPIKSVFDRNDRLCIPCNFFPVEIFTMTHGTSKRLRYSEGSRFCTIQSITTRIIYCFIHQKK